MVAFSQASRATRCAPLLLEPLARGDEPSQRLRELGDQRLARRCRQIVPEQHGFANGREMAKPSNNPVEREGRYGGSLIFHEHEARRRAHLGNGGGHRAWQVGAIGDGLLYLRLSGRNRVDEIRIEKQR